MIGRWTIRWQPFTATERGGYRLDGSSPWPGEDPMPVVPCDDAAVERARQAIIAVVGDHLRFNVAAYGKAWTEEVEDTSFIVADAAEKALRAAGEMA